MNQFQIAYLFEDEDHPTTSISCPNLYESYLECRDLGFNWTITQMSYPGYAYEDLSVKNIDNISNRNNNKAFNSKPSIIPIPISSDFILQNSSWNTYSVIRISPIIIDNIENEENDEIRNINIKLFLDLFNWAVHIGLIYYYSFLLLLLLLLLLKGLICIFVPITFESFKKIGKRENLKKLINECLLKSSLSFYIELPFVVDYGNNNKSSISSSSGGNNYYSYDDSFLPEDPWF
jgi:hypothetical protein